MTGIPMQRGSSVYKLDQAILWEIFSTVAAKKTPESRINNMPLTIIHRVSQVCKNWRDILLGSSSIWGQCMEIHLLNQISDHWRNLILERTGQSMLKVTGVKVDRPKSGLIKFILNLLDKHWGRIQELSFSLKCSRSNSMRIWNNFRRPTENLKIFSISLFDSMEQEGPPIEEIPPNFQLFSNHAPSLTLFCIKIQLPIHVLASNTKSLSVSNLRDFILILPLNLKCNDLLNALIHMPALNKLVLSVPGIIRSHTSELTSLRPHMPHLRMVGVNCPDLDIYPALIDHIIPSDGYAFRLDHSLPEWSELAMYHEKIKYLQCALKCYADSFFSHCERESYSDEIYLHPFDLGLVFKYHNCFVKVEVPEGPGDEDDLPYIISAWLLDTISTLHIPAFITKLELELPCREDISVLYDSLFQALKSIPSIVELVADLTVLLHLGCILGSEFLLPRLEMITLPLNVYARRGLKRCVLPFLVQRSDTTPVKILRIKYNGGIKDFQFLDIMAGLKVSWVEGGKLVEYVCGSGDKSQLILLDFQNVTRIYPSIF